MRITCLRDRDGALWIATTSGLVHVHEGRTDTFADMDGLSGNKPALWSDTHTLPSGSSAIERTARTRMKAQEQERIRIAGELHDGVMQDMLAVTMMLGTAKRRIPDNSDAKVTIDKAQQKLVQAGTDIRQLSHDLHPPLLQEAGLPKALHSYCEQFSAASGIPVACDADESVGELSRGAALALFRIVQEALGNALKHAAPKRIIVRLSRSVSVVTLTVSDDGVGFERGRFATEGGLGLIMMRERATQLNGTFEFGSAPGRGTTVRVTVPFR
jgi:two-component system NarL family sensor kinase